MGGNRKNVEKRNHVKKTGIFGRKVSIKSQNYLKKGSGHSKLPRTKPFTYKTTNRKPQVPAKENGPIMGLKTETNYIISNAIKTILTEPPTLPEPQNGIWKHPNHGKIPEYLEQVKTAVQEEKIYEQNLIEESRPKNTIFAMDESERRELLSQLKEKWRNVNTKYQQSTHLVVLDTLSKVRRKERFEAELNQIEKDIKLLSANGKIEIDFRN